MPPTDDRCPPPLTRWGSIWRYLLTAVIAGVAWSPYVEPEVRDNQPQLWVDLGVGLLGFLVLHQRRRHPLLIGYGTAVMGAVSGIAGGPATLAAVSVATRRKVTEIVPLAVVNVAGAMVYVRTHASVDEANVWLDLTFAVIVVAATMGWGMFIGSRRELLASLRDRAERAEAEQGLRAEKARVDERARIAREMHDVLAHRISQVSMHAGALSYRENLSADQVHESAVVIRDQANRALLDLRAVLGVLRDPGTGELLDKPQPTYDDVSALVAESRAIGMHVEFTEALPGRTAEPMSEATGRTLYRIVQEGLTNVRKHAPATTVTVQVTGDPEHGVEVAVANPRGFGPARSPGTPGSGLGLVGLAERAELLGGRLEFGEDGDRFVLRGWLPWSA